MMTPVQQTHRAIAPGKLIISGEHAVLYGQPALAIAINRYTTTIFKQRNADIYFDLIDLDYRELQNTSSLKQLSLKIADKYEKFTNGLGSILEVLEKPSHLIQYTIAKILDDMNVDLQQGLEISVSSTVPIGCGMGSSAATIMSTMMAGDSFFNKNTSKQQFMALGRNIEHLQHGRSSGVDLHLVTYGGCVFFDKMPYVRNIPKIKMHIVNTGQPATTTGECVAHAAQYFKDENLALEFGKVTRAIDAAFTNNDLSSLHSAISHNNYLLQKIGVVPNKVADFIKDIEKNGGCAKVCGAGAVFGNSAGIVLVIGDYDFSDIANKYDYKVETLEVDVDGTRII